MPGLHVTKSYHSLRQLNNTVFIPLCDYGMNLGPLRQKTRQGFLK